MALHTQCFFTRLPLLCCAEINQLKQEKEDIDKQLRTKYMQQVNETSKLREAEKKLHAAESRSVARSSIDHSRHSKGYRA